MRPHALPPRHRRRHNRPRHHHHRCSLPRPEISVTHAPSKKKPLSTDLKRITIVGMHNLARVATIFAFSAASVACAQKLTVRIIDRRTAETNYTYQVPGHSMSQSYGNADCSANSFGNTTTANCAGSSLTNTLTTAPHQISFNVTGATFALLLPDGRVAVVNCVSKFAERMAGPAGNHRSCRTPIVDDIDVDFKGNHAKLEWVVSLDGKKKESETYNILGILPSAKAPSTTQPSPRPSNPPTPTN